MITMLGKLCKVNMSYTVLHLLKFNEKLKCATWHSWEEMCFAKHILQKTKTNHYGKYSSTFLLSLGYCVGIFKLS